MLPAVGAMEHLFVQHGDGGARAIRFLVLNGAREPGHVPEVGLLREEAPEFQLGIRTRPEAADDFHDESLAEQD